MPRHSHRRRHPAPRRASGWFQLAAWIVVTLIGLGVLVGLCLMTPAGRVVLMVLGAAAALVAVFTLSCAAGRIAAEVRNAIALQTARARLEKRMRVAGEECRSRDAELHPHSLA